MKPRWTSLRQALTKVSVESALFGVTHTARRRMRPLKTILRRACGMPLPRKTAPLSGTTRHEAARRLKTLLGPGTLDSERTVLVVGTMDALCILGDLLDPADSASSMAITMRFVQPVDNELLAREAQRCRVIVVAAGSRSPWADRVADRFVADGLFCHAAAVPAEADRSYRMLARVPGRLGPVPGRWHEFAYAQASVF
jgi:hypothetical protein